MRVIIDTNILIYREDYSIISDKLQKMMNLLSKLNIQILLHPLSITEIEKDKDNTRRDIIRSKISAYTKIDNPPDANNDESFYEAIGQPKNEHDVVDNQLLYCIHKNVADFLITEDMDIHRKSDIIGVSQRVFTIEDCIMFFQEQFLEKGVKSPPALKYEPVHNINYNDPFFDSLRKQYDGFDRWWQKISREGRNAWVYIRDNSIIEAILLYKKENEPIDGIPVLGAKNRLKICTLKVSKTGYKIGELFIKISIDYAVKNGIDEIYLTHFTEPSDYLVELIKEYGFHKRSVKRNGEGIFVKNLTPSSEKDLSPIEIAREFYPSYYDGPRVKKFIIPIKPQFYDRLFTDYERRQPSLKEFFGEFIVEGNTIKKAYLSHSLSRKMSIGDILLFYRSKDSELLTVGVIEKVYYNVTDVNDVIKYVGKRSVYKKEEIDDMVKKPTKIIIFRKHFHFARPLKLTYLLEDNIIKRAPQSIVEIDHERYIKIKVASGINERFTVNKT